MARSSRATAALSLLVLSLALCAGSRQLLAPGLAPAEDSLQLSGTGPAAASGPSTSPAAAAGPAQAAGPAAAAAAPTQIVDAQATPAAGPALAASGPLPAGVVSLAAKRKNSNKAAADAEAATPNMDAAAPTTISTQGQGQYSWMAPIQNAGTGKLPGGFTSNKVSASALAAAQAKQATNSINAQRLVAADVTQVVGSKVSAQDAAAVQSSLGEEVPIHPTDMAARTVAQVNADAPVYTAPSGVAVRPQLRTASQGASNGGGGGTNLAAAKTRTTTAAGQPLNAVQGASSLDGEVITGDYISGIVGVRIATPFFGTGFNFCIDRYFGSFPKVGIVIPNAGAWLLPEFQDLAEVLEHTLDLPTILPHGARVDPTSDGFLLWLPSFQPSQVPDFGIRYGIQIGQAFGYDFGIGIIRDICFVSFVIV